MTIDRRRAMLWAILVSSVLFTTYTLRPDPRSAVPTRSEPAAPPPDAAAANTPVVVVSAAGTSGASEPISTDTLTEWRAGLGPVNRDPFFTAAELNPVPTVAEPDRPISVAAPLPDYTVTLVLAIGSTQHALVGDQLVVVGDMLGNERVADISPDGIVLERGGSRRLVERTPGAEEQKR